MAEPHGHRTSRKNERTSSTNRSDCSKAAKCPPRSGSFQWRMSRKRFSAHRRDGRWSSLGKIEQPVGTATVSVVGPEVKHGHFFAGLRCVPARTQGVRIQMDWRWRASPDGKACLAPEVGLSRLRRLGLAPEVGRTRRCISMFLSYL